MNFYIVPTFALASLKLYVPIFEYSTMNFAAIFPMFDQIHLYDVITCDQNLKYWKTDFIFGFLTLKLV